MSTINVVTTNRNNGELSSSSPVTLRNKDQIRDYSADYSRSWINVIITPVSVDFSTNDNFKINLSNDAVLNTFINPKNGQLYSFQIIQDSIGYRSIIWPSNILWPNGQIPLLTTNPNALDLFVFVYDASSNSYLNVYTSLNLKNEIVSNINTSTITILSNLDFSNPQNSGYAALVY